MTSLHAVVSESFDLHRLLVASRNHYLASFTNHTIRQDAEKRLTNLARRILDLGAVPK
jgi:hypothetical protein